MSKKLLLWILTVCTVISISVPKTLAQDHIPYRAARQMESLGRGLVAIQTDDGVFLSWRLLGTENYDTTFNIYKNGSSLISGLTVTNYVDSSASPNDTYEVTAVYDGMEQARTAAVQPLQNQYFDIPIDRPSPCTLLIAEKEKKQPITGYHYEECSYMATDVSCGDLDGDGEYELVLRWDCNPQDNGEGFSETAPVYLDAYKMKFDGSALVADKLWRISLGKNIRSGEHYNQFTVYDLDGDGKAEVYCKTAPGTVDGKNQYVSEKSTDEKIYTTDNTIDYREEVIFDNVEYGKVGRVLTGPEFFTVFDGETGEALDTIAYPTPRGNDTDNTLNSPAGKAWGDDYGNRCDRFLMTAAYLDGITPNVVTWRGYYGGQSGKGPGRTAVNALGFDGERLELTASFDTYSKAKHGYMKGNENYIGQGNHNIVPGDVDGDGKDEILAGALALDNDLTPLWCSNRGHGDASHLANYDPIHDGLEFMAVHEDGTYGATVFDAKTGTELFHKDGSKDTGRGLMANIGDIGYYQITAASGVGQYSCGGNTEFTEFSTGRSAMTMNFRIFWDGDVYDELLDGITITKYTGGRPLFSSVFTADGCTSINSTKSVPSLQADLFGDWREELVFPTSDFSALRVYTTVIPTNHKLYTLMHDPNYRMQVSTEISAYNQPPHIGYYVSESQDQYDERQSAAYVKTLNAPPRTENIPDRARVSVTDITLEKDILLKTKEQKQLNAEIYPTDALNQAVKWSTGNPAVATVTQDGMVTAISEGTAKITVEATDNSGVSAECTVTVADEVRISEFENNDGALHAIIQNVCLAPNAQVIFAVNHNFAELTEIAENISSKDLTYQAGDTVSIYVWDFQTLQPWCIGKEFVIE